MATRIKRIANRQAKHITTMAASVRADLTRFETSRPMVLVIRKKKKSTDKRVNV